MPSDANGPKISKFDRWVGDNNPEPQLQYGRGFWGYIELIRELTHKFGASDERVVGTYTVHKDDTF